MAGGCPKARLVSAARAASAGAAHQSNGLARERSAQGADSRVFSLEARQFGAILRCGSTGTFSCIVTRWTFIEGSFKEETRSRRSKGRSDGLFLFLLFIIIVAGVPAGERRVPSWAPNGRRALHSLRSVLRIRNTHVCLVFMF